jgi:flagellar biosynthesis protein FliR
MVQAALNELLSAQIFGLFLVFARVGSAFVVLPGFGEAYVTPRIRLLLAVAVSFAMAPAVASRLPGLPSEPAQLLLLLGEEIGIGLFLGMIARLMLAALQVAGMIIGLQTSLANAFAFDPAFQQQGAVTSAWLAVIGLVLIFVTDLHHLMLRAIADSYVAFPAGALPPIGDMAEAVTRVVSASFKIGVQMAAPFLAFGFIFFLAVGLLSRLMPQVQIFFIAMPAQIILGLAILVATLTIAMTVFLDGFEATLTDFIQR